jgi:hypothetical protein
MQVHVLSAFPAPPADPTNFAFLWLRESAEQDPFGRHTLTDDPDQADIILFVENHSHDDTYLLRVRHHPVYRRFAEKCFLYHDNDYAVAVLRGIYPSIRKRDYLADRCRGGGYIARIAQNDSIRYDPAPRPRKWLYSFLGEANSPVRRALFAGTHPDGLVRDTTGVRMWQMPPGPEREQFTMSYAEAILDSQFVLCPAGCGPSSFRLFEAMEMGRAPIILSDEWVPPPGPQWDEFSVRVPESLVGNISSIVREFSERHEAMGRAARAAWERWFAKPVCFHRLVELCAEIQATPPAVCSALRAWGTLFRPPHLRISLQPHYRRVTMRLGSGTGRLRRLARIS